MAQRHAPLTFPDRPRNLKIGDELNRGAWGAVHNGELEGRPVAVKRIHELLHQGRREEERRKVLGDFREECKKLQAFNHPHVVGFIGAFNDPKLGPILVMEKMQENLHDFLNRWKNKLPLPKQLRITLEIIRGVAFLHQQTPPLVHRDLNDKNVMFSFEGVIKIGDFGQSKLKKDLYLTTGQPGMVTFMPPEALKDHEVKYNESLDIFSVGVLMLEIGTQQEPLGNLYGIGTIREVERREKHLKVLDEDHPFRPQILLCLKDNPKERPKAAHLQREVLAMVDGSAKSSTQAEVASRDAKIRELEERCELLEAQLKEKEELLQCTREACAGSEQELSKLHTQHETLSNKNAALKAQMKNWEKDTKAFKAVEDAYQKTFEEAKTYKELYRDAESKRAAAASRVHELMMVVNVIEAKGHGDAGENVERLKTQFNALEAASQRVTTEKQQLAFAYQDLQKLYGALQRENEALKGQQRVMATGPEMSLAPRSAQSGQFRSLQGSVDAVGPKNGNGGRGDVYVAPFAGDFIERDSPPSSNIERAGPSSYERISLPPTSLPRGPLQGVYMNPGRGRHAGSDAPMPKGYPPVRYPPQAVVGMSHAKAEGHKVPPAQAHMYAPSGPSGKYATDPYVQQQESSVSASTEGTLPMPLTRPGAVTPLNDSLLSGFEANQRYIGEGINSEIKHEAHRYKKSEKAVVAAPALADDEEWPLDPNLTCPYCNVVFRRGQMREYRYHIDVCQP